jgi:uncharacterized protein (DUF934 family)
MRRAGFDAFEVGKPADAAAFADAIERYSVVYQPSGDGPPSAARRRLGRARISSTDPVAARS